jgi:hypothetical protein
MVDRPPVPLRAQAAAGAVVGGASGFLISLSSLRVQSFDQTYFRVKILIPFYFVFKIEVSD